VQPALLQLGAAYHYSYSLPDRVAGATYEKKFVNGYVAKARAATVLSPGVYIGGSFGHWGATRKLDVGGTVIEDILNYQTLGLEVGAYYDSSPRTFFTLIAGAHYPLKGEVASTSGGVSSTYWSDFRWALELRGAVGIRIVPKVSLGLEAGYHWANLRYLNSASGAYLAGDVFDLSGAFFGVNLGIHI